MERIKTRLSLFVESHIMPQLDTLLNSLRQEKQWLFANKSKTPKLQRDWCEERWFVSTLQERSLIVSCCHQRKPIFLPQFSCVDPSTQHPLENTIHWGLATLDLSTGEFWIVEYRDAEQHVALIDELLRLEPREIIFPTYFPSEILQSLKDLRLSRLVSQDPNWFSSNENQLLLTNHFHIQHTEDLGLTQLTRGVEAAGSMLRYLQATQPGMDHQHIQKPRLRSTQKEMSLDGVTIRNLELIKTLFSRPRMSNLIDGFR